MQQDGVPKTFGKALNPSGNAVVSCGAGIRAWRLWEHCPAGLKVVKSPW